MSRLLMAIVAASFMSGCSALGFQSTPVTFTQGFEALKVGDYARAEPLLLNALATKPNDPYTLLSLGLVANNTGRQAEAERYYRSAAEFGENAPLGETTGIDPATGDQFGTVRDLALFNLSQYQATPAAPVYQPSPVYEMPTVTTYEAAPAYEAAPVTTYDAAPAYETQPAPSYEAAPTYEVTPTYDTAIPTLGEPSTYGAVPTFGTASDSPTYQ